MVRDFVREGRSVPLPPGRGEWHEPFVDRWKLKLELFDLYGALPAAGDRHLAEFFPYFLTEAAHRGADYGVQLTTIPHRQQQVATARANVLDAIETDLPPLARSPEATADIVSAVANGRSMRTIVNLPNTGQIDNLPRRRGRRDAGRAHLGRRPAADCRRPARGRAQHPAAARDQPGTDRPGRPGRRPPPGPASHGQRSPGRQPGDRPPTPGRSFSTPTPSTCPSSANGSR